MQVNLEYTRNSTRQLLKPYLEISRFSDKKLGETIIQNGVILPGSPDLFGYGGIIDQNNNWVEAGAWHEGFGGPYPFDKDTIEHSDETVIYIGYLHIQWGHNITDNFKKLWFLFTDKYKELESQGVRVVYVSMYNKDLPEFVLKTFRCAGIDTSKICHITKPTQFKNIIIPDNSLVSTKDGRIYTKEYIEIIERIKNSVNIIFKDSSIKTYDKLYFTRAQIPNNHRDYGEKEIEQLFEEMGYAIIAPEKIETLEQIYLLMN